MGRIAELEVQLDAERLKADTYMKSSAEWFIANKYTQQQLDAERIRREQVEMANYAKDGQIETLQAERDRLREGLERIARYGKDGICPYGCDTPNIATAALTPAAGSGKP